MIEIQNLEERQDGTVAFEIKEDGAQWKEALNRVSEAMQKQKPVQGYRPGNAPLSIAYNTYGQPMIDQAVNEFLSEAIKQVCGEHDYFQLTKPDINITTADLSTLCASVSMVIYPKVADFDYTGLEVEKPVKTVSETEIDEAVKLYMKGHPWVHEVEREARMGDTAEVSFDGTCNGEPFEFNHCDKRRFKMGSGALFAGLDEALEGHKAGEELDLSLTMPETFQRKALRGKTLDLHVCLRGVYVREIRECTDEFVKENVKGAETVAEFRELQRTRLQKSNDARSERAFDRNLQRKLSSLVTCPVPASMLEVSIDGFVRSLAQFAAQQRKKMQQVLEERHQTLDDFKKEVTPVADLQVRVSIALDYILRKEKLEVSQEAIDKKVKNFMTNSKLPYETALKYMGGVENVTEKLQQEQAYNFVREHCRVIEVEVDSIPTGW
ncbi:MAG: trigger factor [Lachnospiraceae bacterium]|nr:trigger factor [Lachnospiraceae bacterium]